MAQTLTPAQVFALDEFFSMPPCAEPFPRITEHICKCARCRDAFHKPGWSCVYWLQLKDERFYVGQTTVDRLVERIQTHRGENPTNCGASWTQLHTPQRHARVRWAIVRNEVAGFAEDAKTKELMAAFSIDQVRGGAYCQTTLSKSAISHINEETNHNKNLCFKCQGTGHYANNCPLNQRVVVAPAVTPLVVKPLTPGRKGEFAIIVLVCLVFFGVTLVFL